MSVSAQNPPLYAKSITRDNGLASNRINCIYEDQIGFIWFGTQDGLNRFAGYDLETYRYNSEDLTTIGDNRITTIIGEKETGNLWIGTEFGLNYFDRAKNVFKRYYLGLNDTIFSLKYDYWDRLWVGSTSGLYRYNNDGTFTSFKHNPANLNSLTSSRVYAIHEDDKHRFYIGTDKGLDIYDMQKDKFTHHVKTKGLIHVRSLCVTKTGDLWIGTYHNGLFYMGKGKFGTEMVNYTKKNGFLLNDRVQAIIEDDKQNLYIADRDGGLIYFDLKNNQVHQYVSDIYNPNSMNSKALRTMIQSSTGIVWIGTYNSGVNYINKNRKPIEHYKINYREDGLFNNNIRCMFQDSEGVIWIGSKEGGGLSRFNRELGTFKHYKADGKAASGLKDDYVFTINEIDKRYLLLGTYRKGIAIFDKQTESFKHFLHDPKDSTSISSNTVYTAFKDKQGNWWVGTFGIAGSSGELNLFNPSTGKFKVVNPFQQVRVILDEDDDNLWIGTLDRGLYLYNKPSGNYIQYTYHKGDSSCIGSNNITSLKKDGKGNLWVGTDGGGLTRIDSVKRECFSYLDSDGLPNNRIFAVLLDDGDNVWASTANGISKFEYENNRFRNYDIRDGLQGNEFESYVALRTRNGEMLFGGRNGFNIFHPDSIRVNTRKPKVIITEFELFYKPVPIGVEGSPLKEHISYTKKLTLNYKQKVVTFKFIALNYTSPEKNKYAYMIEGFDEDWNYIGNQRDATYTNLPAGDYVFRVKASNNDGVWNEEGASILLTVLPAPWNTWLFRVMLAFFIAGSGLIFYLNRMLRMKRREQELVVKVEERTSDLQQANRVLEDRQKQIEIQNKKLVESKGYLKQLNQKLSNLNEQILSQNIQLELTIEELSSTHTKLVQSEKMASLGILTAGIAHEINNPLNFIEGGKTALVEYFEDNLPDQFDRLKPLIGMIEMGIDRATSIVFSLNRFNHKSDGMEQDCIVELIIDNCLVMINNNLKHRIQILKEYTKKLYVLKGNEGELHQVFLNILTNAEQSIEGKGKIFIRTRVEEDNLVVEIEDTGCGIAEEHMKSITDPFFTTKDPGKGTGLGLSITYSIMEQHSGNISFRSIIQQGTTVIVTLPVSKINKNDIDKLSGIIG